MTLTTGRVDDLASPPDSTETDTQSSLLAAMARSAEELSRGKGWPDGVENLLAALGRITGVNVVWIFQIIELTDDHILLDYPFEWADKPEHANREKPRFNLLRWDFATASPIYIQMTESRKRGEWQSLIVPEMTDCDLKRDLAAQGIKSMLTIPIMVEDEWWGILGFDDFERICRWSDKEIALLRTATYLLSNAILRDRLASKKRQFEIMESITESYAWELNVSDGHFWCSQKFFSNADGPTRNTHISLYAVMRRIHPVDRRSLIHNLRASITDKQRGKQGEKEEITLRQDMRMKHDNGVEIWIEVIAKISLNRHGKLQKLAGIIVEIPERKAKEEQLHRKATMDPLTGMANRSSFDALFAQYVRRFAENGEIFSLLILDLDHFKQINDAWGHATGDSALKHATQTIAHCLRETDFPARIGGEEFAIILPGINRVQAKSIAERIRKDVCETPLVTPVASVPLSLSIGSATLTRQLVRAQGLTTEVGILNALFRMADSALYAAKDRGRNQYVSVHEMDTKTARNAHISGPQFVNALAPGQ